MCFASQDFCWLLRYPPPSVYFQWWYQTAPREGRGTGEPAGMTALIWGGSAGCECSAACHGLEQQMSNSVYPAGFLLQIP